MSGKADAPPSFVPSQAVPRNEAHAFIRRLNSTTTQSVAQHCIRLLQLPFPAHSTLHDNGCGRGEVSVELIATNLHPSVQLHATDTDAAAMQHCQSLLRDSGVQGQAVQMAAEALSFPDDFFSHSFSSFVLYFTANDGADAARHIFRTLRPGGTALVTTWATVPHHAFIRAAHSATRANDVPFPTSIAERWCQPAFLEQLKVSAGFERDRVQLATTDVVLRVGDVRQWATVMWSFMGSSSAGWLPSDEQHWDEATNVIVREINNSSAYRATESGDKALHVVANIVIAIK